MSSHKYASLEAQVGGGAYDGPLTFDDRRSIDDYDFLGDRLPERISHGPVRSRRWTDIICLVIFCIHFIGLIVLLVIFILSNNISSMSLPLDSDSRICGKDIVGYPYLYMFKFSAPYRSVCVKDCLKFDYNQIKYNSTGTNTTSIQPLYFENYSSVVPQSYSFANPADYNSSTRFSYDSNFAGGYFTQSQFDAYRNGLKLNCTTNNDVKSCSFNPSDNIQYYDSRPYAMNVCFPLSPRALNILSVFGNLSKDFTLNFSQIWWIYVLAVVSALLVSALFTLLTSPCLYCLILLESVLIILLFLFAGVYIIASVITDFSGSLASQRFPQDFIYTIQYFNQHKIFGGILGAVFILIAIWLAYQIVKFRDAIKKVCIIISYSIKVFLKNFHLIFIGLACFTLQILTVWGGVYIFLGIYSSGTQNRDAEKGSPIMEYNLNIGQIILLIMEIISTIWAFFFWSRLSEFIAAGTTVNHYFSVTLGFSRAFVNVISYHLGSVSLAAILMPPINLLQFLLGWLFDILTVRGLEAEKSGNTLNKVTGVGCFCFVYPYRKFVLRLLEAGYGMVYLASCDFCPGSKEAYYLFLGYADKLGKIDMVTGLYRFISVIFISLLNSIMFWLFFRFIPYFQNQTSSPIMMGFIVFWITVVISIIFLNMLTTITQTAALCFLAQVDGGRKTSVPELESMFTSDKDPLLPNK